MDHASLDPMMASRVPDIDEEIIPRFFRDISWNSSRRQPFRFYSDGQKSTRDRINRSRKDVRLEPEYLSSLR